MEVRHGTLLNVYGKPARHGDYVFMPAYVKLDGLSFTSDFRLCNHSGVQVPWSLRHPMEQGFDAAWVRARIPVLFGFTPEPAEAEKELLNVGFAAVAGDGAVCYPFICTDHHGISTLIFSEEGPTDAVKNSIAEGFWGSLALEPAILADFQQRGHFPEPVMYGCESGRVYCEDLEE